MTGLGITEGTLGTHPGLGYRNALAIPGKNWRHDGSTDRACRSPTFFKEEMARRNTVLTVRNLNRTSSKVSKGTFERASKTTAKSQVGILGRTRGLSLPIPRRNRVTSGFLPRDWLPTGEWWAEIASIYTLNVYEDNPEANLSCRNSNTDPIGYSTGSSWWLWHQHVKSCHLAAYDFLVEGALDWRMVSTTSIERPDAMRCAPSEATPTASTTLGGGERWCPLPERGDPAVRESPMESLLEGLPGPQTMDGPASTALLTIDLVLTRTPCPDRCVLCTEGSTLYFAFSLNHKPLMGVRTTSRCRTANCSDCARIKQWLM